MYWLLGIKKGEKNDYTTSALVTMIAFRMEKVSQNMDPSKNQFFYIDCQYWTGTSALQPFLIPPDPWGGLGGPRGVWGGLPTPKMSLSLGEQFQPWNAKFWVKTTCKSMFLRFWVKRDTTGTKNGRFGPR